MEARGEKGRLRGFCLLESIAHFSFFPGHLILFKKFHFRFGFEIFSSSHFIVAHL